MAARLSLLIRSFLLLGFSGAMTLGCSDLGTLKEIDPQAGTFTSSLASEYLAYADAEAELQQKGDAEHFARKGLEASKGKQVAPEAVIPGHLPPALYAELEKARLRLLHNLDDTAKTVLPQKAARAQLLFDCWLDQASEQAIGVTNTLEDPQACREEFDITLADLEHALRNNATPRKAIAPARQKRKP